MTPPPAAEPPDGPMATPAHAAGPDGPAAGPGAAARPRRTDRFAVAALVCGLLGVFVVAVGCGIVALTRTGRHGDRGRGLAVAGIAAGLAWAAALAVVVALAVTSADDGRDGAARDGVQSYPAVGECFDLPGGRLMTETRIVPCDRPHEAELVLTYDVTGTLWPGTDVLEALGRPGCRKRLLERFGTRSPAEGGEVVAFLPQRPAWPRDRAVHCAVTGPQAVPLTGPVSALGYQARVWDELRPGDCFDPPRATAGPSVRYLDCAKEHGAQLTHRFETAPDFRADDRALQAMAERRCSRLWRRLRTGRPVRPPVAVSAQVAPPDLWGEALPADRDAGVRLVLCYVRPQGRGRLTGSLMPAPLHI